MDTVKSVEREKQKIPDEAELLKLNQQLEDALHAAEAANRAKSAFLSNMSHDIRTPMNAIAGMTTIALTHIDEKSRVQDCLQKIQTASTHLMSLVNDVLDLSRIDSGRMSLNEEVFSLADLIHDITVIVRPQAVQKGHALKIEIGQIYEESLIGDPLRLRQIFVNIISNSVKYTPDNGEILVEISQRRADGADQKKKDCVWFDFVCEDNGIGMSPEFLEKIFVPFERAQNTTTSKIEGTGLGMSIVKNLVDRMGGQIQVESTEGLGSSFRIELPLSVMTQNRKSKDLLKGKKVLIAENIDDRAQMLITYLTEGGLVPTWVRKGLDTVASLTQAQSEEQEFSALLLGQELSDMTVLDLASHVRQSTGPAFPILLISEADWVQMEYRATRAGISAFVPCPLFKDRLFNTLSNLININQNDLESSMETRTDYSNNHILLVEDNEINQEIALEMLSISGASTDVAGNGKEAVQKFEDSPEHYYNLILMDVQMPIMDGYEATKQIRRLPRPDAETVSIVAMTANAFVEDIRTAKDAGMNEHLSKPVSMEQLQDILHRLLKKREKD